MNLKEAKTYALDELRLERDFVRTFGKLTATQTWLDAIVAVEEAANDDLLNLLGPDELSVVEVEATEIAQPHVEAAASASAEEATEPNDSLIAFWESEPEQVSQQPLAVLPPLDEAWDEPDPHSPGSSAVIVYPLIIVLMMLWATVQVLLLSGKAVCWVLTQTAERLDAIAQQRLQQHRDSARAPAGAELSFVIA